MLKIIKRWVLRIIAVGAALAVLFLAWLVVYATSDLSVKAPVQFSLKHGSSLRNSARQPETIPGLNSSWPATWNTPKIVNR